MALMRCPTCNQVVAPPDHYLGKCWRCPSCQQSFVPMPKGAGGPLIVVADAVAIGPVGVRRRVLEWLIAALLGGIVGAALMALWQACS